MAYERKIETDIFTKSEYSHEAFTVMKFLIVMSKLYQENVVDAEAFPAANVTAAWTLVKPIKSMQACLIK